MDSRARASVRALFLCGSSLASRRFSGPSSLRRPTWVAPSPPPFESRGAGARCADATRQLPRDSAAKRPPRYRAECSWKRPVSAACWLAGPACAEASPTWWPTLRDSSRFALAAGQSMVRVRPVVPARCLGLSADCLIRPVHGCRRGARKLPTSEPHHVQVQAEARNRHR